MAAINLSKLRLKCYHELQNIYGELALCGLQDEDQLDELKRNMMMLLYDKENDYFMAIASLAALRSKDPRTPIGACIVNTQNKVVGIGYNTMPYTPFYNNDQVFSWERISGKKNPAKYQELDKKHPYVCHAAVNAIVNRTIPDLTDCTIYLTQHPDEDCAHLIAQSGIRRVKYMRNIKRGNKDFEENARRILSLERVSLVECNPKSEVEVEIKRSVKNSKARSVSFISSEIKLLELEKAVKQLGQEKIFFPTALNGERILIQMNDAKSLDGIKDSKDVAIHTLGPATVIQKYSSIGTTNISSDDGGLEPQEPLTIKLKLSDRIKNGKDDQDQQAAGSELVLSWEEFFMGLAELECVYSNDTDLKPDYKVGACLVNPSKQVLAIGGSSGAKDLETLGEGKIFATKSSIAGNPYDQHAEYKTIASYKGMESLRGSTLYVTLMPCNVCAKLIAQSGIVEVVYKKELKDGKGTISEEIFSKCCINCRKIESQEFRLNIAEAKPPKTFPLKWMETTCLRCTKDNKKSESTEEEWSWSIESLLTHTDKEEKLKNELGVRSVDIFSRKSLPKETISVFKFARNNSSSQYDSIKPLKDTDGHFRKEYSSAKAKVKKDVALCKIKKKAIEYFEEIDIYVDVIFSNAS